MADNRFKIVFSQFYLGYAPAAHVNSLTEIGNHGHASAMQNVNILVPDYITQGPALSDLTNGTQAGAVDELINFIMDTPVSGATYGIGPTKLFRITSTTVTSGSAESATWPHTITGATDGESVIEFLGNLYYFFNKASGGDIGQFNHSGTFDDDWGSTVPTGAAALQSARHPVAKKEDLMVFGNGRYLGTYNGTTTTLAPTKLDFGNDAEVVDVVWHSNLWWIAVNYSSTSTDRARSEIYLYDGAAIVATLSDETAVGLYRIGFLYVLNGTVWVTYEDLSDSSTYALGYINGRRLEEVATYTGGLPDFGQKTLYRKTILFVAGSLVWSVGARFPDLPIQVSQHADGGHATVGAIAAPFGTPMVASTDGASNQRVARFSGVDTACTWQSIIVPLSQGGMVGHLESVEVLTNHLGASARVDLDIEWNQQQSSLAAVKQVTTAGQRRHFFKLGFPVEDFNIKLDWSNGHATNDARVRQVVVVGRWKARAG